MIDPNQYQIYERSEENTGLSDLYAVKIDKKDNYELSANSVSIINWMASRCQQEKIETLEQQVQTLITKVQQLETEVNNLKNQ